MLRPASKVDPASRGDTIQKNGKNVATPKATVPAAATGAAISSELAPATTSPIALPVYSGLLKSLQTLSTATLVASEAAESFGLSWEETLVVEEPRSWVSDSTELCCVIDAANVKIGQTAEPTNAAERTLIQKQLKRKRTQGRHFPRKNH